MVALPIIVAHISVGYATTTTIHTTVLQYKLLLVVARVSESVVDRSNNRSRWIGLVYLLRKTGLKYYSVPMVMCVYTDRKQIMQALVSCLVSPLGR